MARLKDAVDARAAEIAAAETAAADFRALLDALPPGQVKLLYKDPTCAAILEKYGVAEQ